MSAISHERCFNHALREAAARCPQCRRYFCRECVTEHDDRVLCTLCLKQSTSRPHSRGKQMARLVKVVCCAAGFLLAWLFFFLIGDMLTRLPSRFHKEVLWSAPVVREE
jgi:hypothetical protein